METPIRKLNTRFDARDQKFWKTDAAAEEDEISGL